MGIQHILLLGLLVLLPEVALAHPAGHVAGAPLGGGLLHPFTGLDHILAMGAVGLWAVQLGGRALWALPAASLTVMLLGGMLGTAGGGAPAAVDLGILTSVLGLGALIAWGRSLPAVLASVVAGGFALCHGYAHGAEMPAATSGLAYGLGFLAATAGLHAVGIGLGLLLTDRASRSLIRYAGAVVLLAGVGLLLQA